MELMIILNNDIRNVKTNVLFGFLYEFIFTKSYQNKQ